MSYTQHAPASSSQLHELIQNTYGIDAFHVHTSTNCANNDQTHAYAYLAVTDEAEGDFLRQHLPGTRLNGARLFIEWAHDSLPGLMEHAVTVASDVYPDLMFHQHLKHGTCKAIDRRTGSFDLPLLPP